MLLVNQLVGFGVGGGGTPVALSYLGNSSSETDLTTYTFSSCALGAAATDRRIVVGAYGRDNGGASISTTALTVGGVSATKIVEVINDSNIKNVAALWVADVPTGTTGDIVVTFSTALVRAGIGWWGITGGAGGVIDSGSSASQTASAPLTVNPGGAVIGFSGDGASATTYTWSNITEDFEALVGTTSSMSGASQASLSGGSLTPSVTLSGSNGHCTVFASF